MKKRVPSCIVRVLLWSAVGKSTSRIGQPDHPMSPMLVTTSADPNHHSTASPAESTDGRHPDESRRPRETAVDPTATANQIVPVHIMRWTLVSGLIKSVSGVSTWLLTESTFVR